MRHRKDQILLACAAGPKTVRELEYLVEMGLSTLKLLLTTLEKDKEICSRYVAKGRSKRRVKQYTSNLPIQLREPNYASPSVKIPSLADANIYICAPLVRHD